ncbi:hypothetical protein Gotri_021412, partial [Gossypium trilobum]|nr:hypothetical protein [Gossypium trilobum]
KVDLEDVVAGGVISDDQGRWILGFNKRLGQYFVFNVGLWGIIDGLLLLKNRHCDKLLIRMNSTEVPLAIHEASSLTSFSALIRRIHNLF